MNHLNQIMMMMLCIDAAVELAWLCEESINDAFERGVTQTQVQALIRDCALQWVKRYSDERDPDAEVCWDDMAEEMASELSARLNAEL